MKAFSAHMPASVGRFNCSIRVKHIALEDEKNQYVLGKNQGHRNIGAHSHCMSLFFFAHFAALREQLLFGFITGLTKS
jgi:hypothetical protein